MIRPTPIRAAAVAALGALALAGCSNVPIDKKTQGQVLGGVTGAAVGSLFGGGSGRIVATGAGAVIGTIAGGELADDL
ncbi:glycine zipper 2TM domain-containing protein [Albimonas sp. CAU 1670]|uniref:glycine zipper 2TM domain-containing protein n=1 Tax=Albimonas sp. CAU 1670 TaxID=3032599 RepID=UPI0023DBB7D1|nr:glycine zipper 2TM domain-containing protein [Albimonas sp. CAU 1670]MDF2231591.1 glycine zipper 2TM domain-containing protein [Albimonas sp. CAU 1670]